VTQTAHSHLPVLEEILDQNNIRTVLEFGMGDGSTGLFLDRCLRVVSVEMNNLSWHEKLTRRWGHRLNWSPVLRLGMDATWPTTERFDMVFVDGHGDCRPEQIRAAMAITDLIVVHDTQEAGYKWERIKDDLPDWWTWTDDKRHPTWTSVLVKNGKFNKETVDRFKTIKAAIKGALEVKPKPLDVTGYLYQRGTKVDIRRKTNLRFINLGITHQCNLSCYSCNRYIDSAPSDDMMTLEQITRFVDESLACKWPWLEVVVYGGEPTIHPDYLAICHEVLRLKAGTPGMTAKVVSNGMGRRVNEMLARTPPGFVMPTSRDLKKTAKSIDGKSVIPEFGNVLQAPCDRITDTILDCQIHATCGLELTPYGFLPCACGGARVMGLDVYFKRLKDITQEACKKRLETLCAICGRNLNYEVKLKDDMEPSEFWRRALAEYAVNPPKLDRY
jgi:hypothetical protein